MDRDPINLPGLPPEVFNLITDRLTRRDKFSLLTVSRAVHALTEPSLYSVVVLKNKAALLNFSNRLASHPHLRQCVRTYRVLGDPDPCCLDPIYQLPSLRRISFQPNFESSAAGEPTAQLVKRIASGDWITQSLKQCSVRLSFSNDEDPPIEVAQQLLVTLLSAPFLEALTACYTQYWDLDENGNWAMENEPQRTGLLDQLQPLPVLEGSKLTNLRQLTLRWDVLPLESLSRLLSFPRRLEMLVLQFSLLRSLRYPMADIPLDTVLEPVVNTLQTLVFEPCDTVRSPDCHEDDFYHLNDAGFRWSSKGLREFRHLKTLGIPNYVFEDQRLDTKNLLGVEHPLFLPESVEEIVFLDSYLLTMRGGGRSPFSEKLAATNVCTLDYAAREMMGELNQAVSDWSKLKRIAVGLCEAEDIIREKQPPVYLEENARVLVEHGVRIEVTLPEGKVFELETKLEA